MDLAISERYMILEFFDPFMLDFFETEKQENREDKQKRFKRQEKLLKIIWYAANKKLSKREKEVFMLKYKEGLNGFEISERTKLHYSSMKTYLKRAIIKIKKYIDGRYEFKLNSKNQWVLERKS